MTKNSALIYWTSNIGGNIKRFLIILVIVFVGYIGVKEIFFHGENVAQGQGLVLGAQSGGDANHPKEIYVGSSQFNNAKDMFAAQNVVLYPEDKVATFPDPANNLGSIITIYRATPVNIVDSGRSISYRTWAVTVKDLLKERNYTLADTDIVKPALKSLVTADMTITITRVSEGDEKEKITVPFKTITKNDATMEKGQQKVETKGVKGVREQTYHVRRENGKLVSKVLVSEKVLIEKVDEVILKGTKPPLVKRGIYKDEINAAALKYGLNPAALYCLMMAESNGHYNSVAAAGYKGLFQYGQGTWNKFSKQAGYAGADIFDPVAQINVTAWAIANGKGASWGPWSGCKNK